ncbi:carbon starvation protein A [Kiritimatiella glycovorans]|uniref:Inner membrane protein YjiY n=1 Tax=Kiritimatiella glycovorans TaxID=1307763 RepID=A0A0G3EH00_9BACT|nr:carbon starvation protein A [Kiritimatiella glycovorans]AKJ64085.1 Inner membrane protein YjiY [Kiritimatiella glycovorans]
MTSVLIALGTAILYLIAYHTYGKFLARRIFRLSDMNECPSRSRYDGVDFVPTDKTVLFGHHFTSIAGTGPIVGPAIAIIWGWLPALLWILIGSVFMGAVHDFGAMCLSLKNQGRSIGDLAGNVITPRIRGLFLVIIFLTLLIVVAIFGVVIASVFSTFPEAVLPCWLQIPIAMTLGWVVYRRGQPHLVCGLVATAAMYLTIVLGSYLPVHLPGAGGLSTTGTWVVILLAYAYLASTLPVQVLLQPRDYINAFQLMIAMGLLLLGILVSRPELVAPAVDASPAGAPPLIPMLFISVACGAVSGFHSLVSSGTSSKQCDLESSALPIAYGGMLMEGLLAVFVLIACGAGLGLGLEMEGGRLTGSAAFQQHYASWTAAQGLGSKVHAFISGASNMVASLGIPRSVIITLMGVFVASFAATTLDTATRIQRYIVGEMAQTCRVPFLSRKHPATAIAVGTALLLAFANGGGGTGALILWPLFGAMNQLLAGLALLVMTVYLARERRTIWLTAVPMIFMLVMTGWSMGINLQRFLGDANYLLFAISIITMALEAWMIVEALRVIFEVRREERR